MGTGLNIGRAGGSFQTLDKIAIGEAYQAGELNLHIGRTVAIRIQREDAIRTGIVISPFRHARASEIARPKPVEPALGENDFA